MLGDFSPDCMDIQAGVACHARAAGMGVSGQCIDRKVLDAAFGLSRRRPFEASCKKLYQKPVNDFWR
ncbi:hypothetical protein NO264_08050 [Gluconacetobacter entanii]|nr:hypothetical protein [Gluconacetobacter entanii]